MRDEMNAGDAIDLARSAVMLTLTVGAPVLATALLVALVVSTLQAVMQVQEHTLSFVPKIAAVLLVAVLAGPWMAAKIMEFAQRMFGSLP